MPDTIKSIKSDIKWWEKELKRRTNIDKKLKDIIKLRYDLENDDEYPVLLEVLSYCEDSAWKKTLDDASYETRNAIHYASYEIKLLKDTLEKLSNLPPI